MHGLLFGWDSGGANWDRVLATTGALHVNVQNSSVAVTGTFWQATQPVSGTFWQATQPVSGTFWQATQPISGTVTAGVSNTAVGNAVAVRCVDTSGTSFEACGGAGGSGDGIVKDGTGDTSQAERHNWAAPCGRLRRDRNPSRAPSGRLHQPVSG